MNIACRAAFSARRSQVQHDRFRLHIPVRGKRVSFYTMTGVDWTARYP